MQRTILTILVCLSLSAPAARAQLISNTANGGYWQYIGSDDGSSTTYGEVFTAPVTGTLASFTLSLNGGIGSLYGGVGTWDTNTAGSPLNLYQSANVSSPGAQSYTFSPNLSVVAGQTYVTYLSVYGDTATNASTSIPTGGADPNLVGFVFNISSNPQGNPAWDGGTVGPNFPNTNPFKNLLFSASFSPAVIPEPSTWAMLLGGVGALGLYASRGKRHAV